jgi:hypothetical protein
MEHSADGMDKTLNRHKRLRLILYWLGALVGWYVYAVAVSAMAGHSLRFPIYLLLLILPILVALVCWIYLLGPANLRRKISEVAKTFFPSRAA